ncbi:Protein aveugle [Halotydeus destructor]|nr:Protein aveugle [Halotydeus destructor]
MTANSNQESSGQMTTTTTDNRRPKPVFFWNNTDVMKWLKRHCEEYYGLYGQMFLEHEITGRQLVRMTDITLQRMGINEAQHRDDLCRIIMKLKLKSDILEMKDLEKKSGDYVSSSSSSMTVGVS